MNKQELLNYELYQKFVKSQDISTFFETETENVFNLEEKLKEAVALEFEEAFEFSNGLARVKNKENNYYYFIDKNGEPFKDEFGDLVFFDRKSYDENIHFNIGEKLEYGYAEFGNSKHRYLNKNGYYLRDHKNKIIVTRKNYKAFSEDGKNPDCIFIPQNSGEKAFYYMYLAKQKEYLKDDFGKAIKFESSGPGNLHYGWICVKLKGVSYYNYINLAGEFLKDKSGNIIKVKKHCSFTQGYAAVQMLDNEWVYLDTKGNIKTKDDLFKKFGLYLWSTEKTQYFYGEF